jgi:hypothetical protein
MVEGCWVRNSYSTQDENTGEEDLESVYRDRYDEDDEEE